MLTRVDATEKLVNNLELQPDEPVYQLERLIEADGIPVAVIHNYLVPAFVPGFESNIKHMKSLYRLLEDCYDIEIESSVDKVNARMPTAIELDKLRISEDTPVIVIRRTAKARGKLFLLFRISY